jgi:hypothetical protein
VTATKIQRMAPGAGRRGALLGLYLAALIVGYLLGENGSFPWHPFPAPRDSPLARVGAALATRRLSLSSEGFGELALDVEAVRAAWDPKDRPVLDLVVAVRGLTNGGNPAWSKAEQLCKTLTWPRCDRAALEVLSKRSRP